MRLTGVYFDHAATSAGRLSIKLAVVYLGAQPKLRALLALQREFDPR